MQALRSTIERFSRNRIVKRQLPNGNTIAVSPDSQLKYLGRQFDLDLTDLAKKYVTADSIVWDIGANCGVFAFSCEQAKEVVAIEADPFLVHLLQASASLNDMPVKIVSAAVSAKNGLAEFSIASRGRASNHLSAYDGRSQTGGERSRIIVPTITLDDLLEANSPPTLIKMDVEGAEADVLMGASRLLNDVKPVLHIETGGTTHADCERILSEAGYVLTRSDKMNWLCTPQA